MIIISHSMCNLIIKMLLWNIIFHLPGFTKGHREKQFSRARIWVEGRKKTLSFVTGAIHMAIIHSSKAPLNCFYYLFWWYTHLDKRNNFCFVTFIKTAFIFFFHCEIFCRVGKNVYYFHSEKWKAKFQTC